MSAALKAVNLKLRHTTFNKLLFICPILTVIFSFISSGVTIFQSLAVYWWYLFIMQGFIAILCLLSQRSDDISGNSIIIHSLSVDLKKVKWASNSIIAIKFAAATMLYMLLVHLIPFFLFPTFDSYGFSQLLLATVALIITSIWQIPFCHILMRVAGRFFVVGFNTIVAILVISFLSNTNLWIICPYCWCSKIMEQLLHIGANGVIVNTASVTQISAATPIVLSIILFVLLGILDAALYEREPKK